ncbi:DsbA family protein [Nonomuraea terrae]|uniref:DsbA family protein n=1 Tax=Nonomuraea terrae TaxID=2530383 RepID=UPI001CB6ED02
MFALVMRAEFARPGLQSVTNQLFTTHGTIMLFPVRDSAVRRLHQLGWREVIRIAHDLGLDLDQFEKELISAEVTGRVHDDMLDAEPLNITAVPTLPINGWRRVDPSDAQSLLRALTTATDPPVAETTDAVVAPRSTATHDRAGDSPAAFVDRDSPDNACVQSSARSGLRQILN